MIDNEELLSQVTIIDLRDYIDEEDIIHQYVNMRNRYVNLLLASHVDVPKTKEWLRSANIEIRGLIKEDVLCGVVILYLDRGAEVSFFVSEPDKGLGTKLLDIIEEVAEQMNLKSV